MKNNKSIPSIRAEVLLSDSFVFSKVIAINSNEIILNVQDSKVIPSFKAGGRMKLDILGSTRHSFLGVVKKAYLEDNVESNIENKTAIVVFDVQADEKFKPWYQEHFEIIGKLSAS